VRSTTTEVDDDDDDEGAAAATVDDDDAEAGINPTLYVPKPMAGCSIPLRKGMVGQDNNDKVVEEGDEDILKVSLLLLRSEDDCPEAQAEAVEEAGPVGPRANAETNEVLVLLLMEQQKRGRVVAVLAMIAKSLMKPFFMARSSNELFAFCHRRHPGRAKNDMNVSMC
jgi:hypothetical protein